LSISSDDILSWSAVFDNHKGGQKIKITFSYSKNQFLTYFFLKSSQKYIENLYKHISKLKKPSNHSKNKTQPNKKQRNAPWSIF
jgi:hypothetical protein